MKKHLLLTAVLCPLLYAYEPGNGLELTDSLKIGGYVALKYENGKNVNKAMVDDVAIMAYGNLGSHTRYLVEFENVGRYEKDFKAENEDESGAFRVERAVVDHSFSSYLNLSAGKMITPVGYWNQTPINVLRDTTSSPMVATNIFPKLITGAQLYGEVYGVEDAEYSVAAQNSRDIDEKYNNFRVDKFLGVGAKYPLSDNSELKAFIGSFNERGGVSKRNFVHLAYRYQKGEWQILSEGAYSGIETSSKNTTAGGGFLQSRYRINDKHYAIGRYEYYFDAHENEREHLGVVGYNYRPIYPVSFKAEYQFSSTPDKSKFLCSISALF